jgi:uncharacterized alkaline shock family protein YloU
MDRKGATLEGSAKGLSGSKPSTPAVGGTERGKTYISDEVVSIIARIAAEQVEGVHQIGDSSLRGMFARLGRSPGIDSDVGLKEAAVDVEIVVTYGYPIKVLAEQLRRTIIESVEFMTGRKVVEVNIHVVDVHVPRAEKKAKRELE